MVKKVIDIIPPQNWSAGQASGAPELRYSREELPQSAVLPEEAGHESLPESKPRITFAVPKAGFAAGASKLPDAGGGFFKGLFLKLAIAAAVIMAAMYGLDVKFAKAVIKVWPETSILHQEVKVAVDPSIGAVDKNKNAVPGFAISVEKTVNGESPVAGRKSAQGKAFGTVKLFNNYTAAQRLVKGTRLQAPLEKFQPELAKDETPWFRTAEDIVLNPKSSSVVKVVADFSGEKYNIEPSVFSVPGLVGTAQYTFIYGQSFEKFAGGSQDSAPEVKKEDLENAKIAIAEIAKEEIKKELEAKVKQQGLEIADESVEKFEIGEPAITAKTGDSIAKIGGQILAKASTVAYKKTDLDNLGREFVLGKVPAGNTANLDSLEIKSSYAGIDAASGRPSLALAAQVMIYSGMSGNDLKKGLSEKSANEARIFLMNQPGTKETEIQLSPPWRFNIPRDLNRIEVQMILD